jgi:hypothetical protein
MPASASAMSTAAESMRTEGNRPKLHSPGPTEHVPAVHVLLPVRTQQQRRITRSAIIVHTPHNAQPVMYRARGIGGKPRLLRFIGKPVPFPSLQVAAVTNAAETTQKRTATYSVENFHRRLVALLRTLLQPCPHLAHSHTRPVQVRSLHSTMRPSTHDSRRGIKNAPQHTRSSSVIFACCSRRSSLSRRDSCRHADIDQTNTVSCCSTLPTGATNTKHDKPTSSVLFRPRRPSAASSAIHVRQVGPPPFPLS